LYCTCVCSQNNLFPLQILFERGGTGPADLVWYFFLAGGEAGGMVGDARGVGSVVICWEVASVVAGGEVGGVVVNVRDEISIIKSEGKL